MANWFKKNAPQSTGGGDWFAKHAPGATVAPTTPPAMPVPQGLSDVPRSASGKEIKLPGGWPIGEQSPNPYLRAAEIMSRPGLDSKAEGASQIIEAAGKAVAPVGAPEALLAPVGSAIGAGVGYLGSKLTSALAQRLGGGAGVQHLAGDVGGAVAAPIAKPLGKTIMRGAAPVAESALGIRNVDRAYQKTPGLAALTHTTGVHPETVSASAQSRLDQITPEYESMVDRSPTPVDLTPALGTVKSAISTARKQNAGETANHLRPLADHFIRPTEGFQGKTNPGPLGPPSMVESPIKDAYGDSILHTIPGTPGAPIIAPLQSARTALDMKRGLSKDFIKWNAQTPDAVRGTAKQAYRNLDSGIDAAVPEGKRLNQVMSSLIPVAQRGAATALNESTGGRILSRVGAKTGALTSAALSATEGAKIGGGPGALIGGLAGLAAPELAVMPSTKMSVARGMFGAGRQLVTPVAANAARLAPLALSNSEEEEKKRKPKQ